MKSRHFSETSLLSCHSSYWVSKDVKDSSISASGAFYYSKHQLTHQISSSRFPCHHFGSLSSQLPINFSFSVYFPIRSFVKVAQMASSAYFIFHITFQVCFLIFKSKLLCWKWETSQYASSRKHSTWEQVTSQQSAAQTLNTCLILPHTTVILVTKICKDKFCFSRWKLKCNGQYARWNKTTQSCHALLRQTSSICL